MLALGQSTSSSHAVRRMRVGTLTDHYLYILELIYYFFKNCNDKVCVCQYHSLNQFTKLLLKFKVPTKWKELPDCV